MILALVGLLEDLRGKEVYRQYSITTSGECQLHLLQIPTQSIEERDFRAMHIEHCQVYQVGKRKYHIIVANMTLYAQLFLQY